ncbi:haloacid dehalogenase-like hydrolase [Streptomyces sp. SID14478]|nr:haloacid dehalogenase-like hydrolase [Streptomyces sp. SID14478]
MAFCDLDETLIDCKSGLDFLRHYFVQRHGGDGARRIDAFLAELADHAARGGPREETNRRYHRAWRGCPAEAVSAAAHAWYRERSRSAGFYLPATLAALRRHQRQGIPVVLVSGSFPLLLPVAARAVGAAHALGARMERCAGVLTGELIGPPAIGEGKRALVRRFLAERPHLDPADCWAYGDHPSDLPMLQEVGHAMLVGADGSHAPVVAGGAA